MPDEVFIEGHQARANSAFLKIDPLANSWTVRDGSVLLLDKIKTYCEDPNIKMIVPFKKELLESASYQLRLGGVYRIDGKDIELSGDEPTLTIEPHGIAIVRTYEWINLPGFLIARWNLKVKKVYKGLVWVGGSQVDPGYQGFLPCPLYNLSSERVHLKYMEPLFVIDFVRTTFYDENKDCRLWAPKAGPRNTASLGALDEDKLKSGVKKQFDDIEVEIGDMRDLLDSHSKNMSTFQTTTFTVLAVLITAVTVLATMNTLEPIKVPPDWTNAGPAWLSILALGLSILAMFFTFVRRKKHNHHM